MAQCLVCVPRAYRGRSDRGPRYRPAQLSTGKVQRLAKRAGIPAAKEALDIRRLSGQCCRVRRRQAAERRDLDLTPGNTPGCGGPAADERERAEDPPPDDARVLGAQDRLA